MNSRKALLPLFTYLIITEKSDTRKHLHQKDILKALKSFPYEITIERKALSRTLYNLADSGLGIVVSDRDGVWFDPGFRWAA